MAASDRESAKRTWLPYRPDEFILRWMLRALIAATVAVVPGDKVPGHIVVVRTLAKAHPFRRIA